MTVDEFIKKWSGLAGGAEKANFGPFIYDLVRALDLPEPEPAEGGKLGPYQFEGPIPNASFRNPQNKGSADLYKRGCFIMEAKQSYMPPKADRPPELFGEDAELIPLTPAGARYDKYMTTARAQVENYAKNLPASEPLAPFLIVCDIGRAFEIYHDSAGNGRGYTFFPDKQSYRIPLPRLRDPKIVERLKAIWTDPRSIDPRFHAADVTRKVAMSLAQVSKDLEEGTRIRSRLTTEREKAEEIEEAALFLMRILFCMFAEDVGLLPPDKFSEFLRRAESNQGLFENQLADLWLKMGAANVNPRFAHAVEDYVKYFNGGLFADAPRTFALSSIDIHHLYEAARQNWRRVEPAIFGTLLEQALSPEERAKLGAHYTPRPYVETLVRATIMDVLEPEWARIEEEIAALQESPGRHPRESGGPALVEEQRDSRLRGNDEALAVATRFHDRLASIRVLDPACGTGNFLYVSMELMQALEARVIETIQTLGGHAEPKVGPHQFHGLEKNPRAAKIAELVLWIGWLRNRLHDDPDSVPQPVLAESANINFGRHGGYDAVLKMDDLGQPDLAAPTIPDWPEAEFIVGNPPFIGKGKDMREALGDDYVEALSRAYKRVPKSADFVMYWWDHAASLLGSTTKRFGLISTNSIKQVFNRAVVTTHLNDATAPISLAAAVYDHPWRGGVKDAAVVRISMTVAQPGRHPGILMTVESEKNLAGDDPEVAFSIATGFINPDLTVGADASGSVALQANLNLSWNGVMLSGRGFIPAPKTVQEIRSAGEGAILKRFLSGKDVTGRDRCRDIIDPNGRTEKDIRAEFPTAYTVLLENVKQERSRKRDDAFRNNWWLFGRNRTDFRQAISTLNRYVVVPETSVYRLFQFVSSDVLPEHRLVCIASDSAYILGVLLSHFHVVWSLRSGGTLEDRPTYTKTRCFDPFPFPDATPEQRATIADLAEELDATRKAALAETDKLTMTELYNLREKLRSGTPMDEKEQRRATKARAAIVNRLHEQLDSAVADAYGWGEEWRQGRLGPSEIVARLVALNHERAAEEKAGKVRWLMPEYQEPRFAKKR